MNILALDPATHTGWALSADGMVHSGTWDLSPRRGDGAGMRFLRLCWKLDEMLFRHAPLHIVYEFAGHFKSLAAGDVLRGLMAHIQSWCETHNVPCEGYAPSSIKKWATGKGNANKDAMLAEAQRRWPDITDHNEADARLLLAMVMTSR